MAKAIGVLGGTFNPVHNGHLILARDLLEAFRLDEVLFIPCARPPHKPGNDLAPVEDRVHMLERALEKEPRFTLSRVEVDRGGVSYTIDTLTQLRQAHPGATFFFLIGSDTLPELKTWRRIDELLTLCRFATLVRPGMANLEQLKQRIGLPDPWPERLMRDVFSGRLIDVSSSDIRRRVREGRSIRDLVPDRVADYIESHRLYQGKERES